MKTFILSLRILKGQIVLNLFLILQVTLVLILANILLNRIDNTFKYVNIIEDSDSNNALLFMGRFLHPNEVGEADKIINDVLEYLEMVDGFIGMSNIHDYSIEVQPNQYTRIISMDSVTAEKFANETFRGIWFLDYNNADQNFIPCVVIEANSLANTYHVGEVLTVEQSISLYDNERQSYIDTSLGTATYIVTGIINRDNSHYFKPYGSVHNYDEVSETLFSHVLDDDFLFLCGETSNPTLALQQNTQGVLYFDDSVTDEQLDIIVANLSKMGNVSKISNMQKESYKILDLRVKSDFPMFVAFLTTAVIGLISVCLLNSQNQLTNFSVYYLCGCMWKKSILIYIIYFSSIISTAFVLYLAFMKISYMTMGRLHLLYIYTISNKNIAISTLFCLFTATICTIIPFLYIKSKSPIDRFKGN